MNKDFIPDELVIELKELGYDEPCVGIFAAPLYSQVFRWFREKYGLYSFIFCYDEGFGYETYKEGVTQTNESFDTYEESELACMKKLIEIVKQK